MCLVPSPVSHSTFAARQEKPGEAQKLVQLKGLQVQHSYDRRKSLYLRKGLSMLTKTFHFSCVKACNPLANPGSIVELCQICHLEAPVAL